MTALVAYLDESSKEVAHSVNDTVPPVINGSKAAGNRALELPTDATERIARFIAAVCEDKALSKFEAAVLSEICDQQPAQVLSVMRSSKKTIAQKKRFLINLAHFGHGDDESAKAATTTPKQNGISLGPHASRPGNAVPSSSSGSSSANAQVELVYKKLIDIARNVFSPEVQTEILAAASSYRAHPTPNGSSGGTGSSAAAKAQSETGLSQKMELIAIIEKLLSKHALPEEQAAYLIRLVLTENRLLLSALQSYKIDYNLGDLEKAVKQIAALGSNAAAAAAPSSSAKGESARGTSKSPKKRSSPRKTPRAPQALKGFVARPIDILHSMHQKQMITSLEYDILGALVKQQDPQVIAAIDEFQRTRDQATLRDTLVFIVEEITMELGDEEKAHFMRSLSIDHTLNVSTVDWQEQLYRYVHHWAEQIMLNPEHVMVLEKLIAEHHNLLQSAYEVFASDEDENELLDTLQRIAKLQLQAEEGAALQLFSQVVNAHCDVLRENEKALVKQLFVRRNELVRAAWEVFEVEKNVHDLGDTLLRIARFTSRNDSKLRLVEVVGEMMRRKLIRSHEGDGLIRLYEEKNEAMLAANEAFESDGDIKELVETLLLVVKHANFGEPPICSPRHSASKNHANYSRAVMPPSPSLSVSDQFESGTEEYVAARLIDTLAKKGRLSDWQRELLLTLLSQNDDRLLAAIDVYNEDQHVRELVDTLWRLCDLLVWEENKRSIIREWVVPLEQERRVAKGVLQQLIEARDDRIMAAFVVYLGDSDDEEFVDTLARIARIALTSFSGAKAKRNDASVTEDVDLEFDIEEVESVLASLVENGLISEDDAAGVRSLFMTYNAQVLAAFDVFHATEDSEDLADTLSRILARHSASVSPLSPSKSKIARMEKQLLHFASELGLAPDELSALKRSIARQDEILEAAVEVYEMENDEVCRMVNVLS